MGVRRVVTTHDKNGKSVVLVDEVVEERGHDRVIWMTDQMPASNEGSADAGEWNEGFTVPYGTVMRMREYKPGEQSKMHRTHSVDYGFVLEGELDMEMDDGNTVHFKAGDVFVQRGTNHQWRNVSNAICRVIFVNFDAHPILIGGEAQPDTSGPIKRGL